MARPVDKVDEVAKDNMIGEVADGVVGQSYAHAATENDKKMNISSDMMLGSF